LQAAGSGEGRRPTKEEKRRKEEGRMLAAHEHVPHGKVSFRVKEGLGKD